MALREKVLIRKAEKFEVKELQKIILNRQQLLILDKLLNDAYVIRRPKPSEYEHRKQLIRVFNEIAEEIYGNSASCPVVEEFGSFSMDLFTTESDLDLSINFRNSSLLFPRDQKIKTLRKFARKFYALQNVGYVKGVQPIMGAKVPIVKVIDTGTGVECDLSVENRDGISKSLIIRFITSIDQRFQKLSFLMKAWAKAHDINSSKDRTLNSLSIILLVAFHLQTRKPPILPPFSAILKDGEDPKSVRRAVRNFENYGIRNTETLGELFVSFLIKLASAEKLWPKGLCASTYLGRWTSKTWDTKIANMSVEDFTDRTQNVARAVGKSEVEKIYECIHLTKQNISLFMNVRIEELALKESLFGIDRVLHHPNVEPKSNVWIENYEKNRHVVTTNPILAVNSWSTRQPPTGHWGVPVPPHHRAVTTGPVNLWVEQPFDHQRNKRTRVEEDIPYHRAVTTGPSNMWAEQSFDHQQTKRMRVAEDVPATQNRWTQGWGGAPNGGWGDAHGAASMDDHLRRSHEMQHARDEWGRRPQPPPYYGSSSNAYGPPFR
ncbi:putative polynucleotide adenylyltransferase [Helianthus annuus]|uniref:Polynucleotide adenylyltransferase n=1 Tax=Helianthus annuus TaxID=4232 RepID=A0A9K3I3D1_HELAN|nr:protein HESO1-like [Helianthus annuus]XP_035833091.1 protein HESO1-like [Helianthus annuus]XP_035833092.1 protein HESO1-like [Helianthus annuus]KAF5789568.1 putative polynucleotide adenylyltransferase [Helianthus annuus]KAJ0532905.1 putative polynucleotide adenylyltransferase [Helianthus annuus]KAJ0891879.1 putative polynucleotide adenylyltransferase [Helianthus annuus]